MKARGQRFADWLTTSVDDFYRRQPLSEMLRESFTLLDSERGLAKVRFCLERTHCNYSGRVHGGIIALILDEAVGVAGFIHIGDRFKSTVESKISYYRALRPGLVEVEAWVSHLTPSMLFMEGQVRNAAGAVAAKSTSTIALASSARAIPRDSVRQAE